MKLSLSIIAEKLDKSITIKRLSDKNQQFIYGRPLFLGDETLLKANTLYISLSENISETLKYEHGSALIIIGDNCTIPDIPSILVLEKNTDIFKLCNNIITIFDIFDNWETQMSTIISTDNRGSVLKKLLDVSDSIIENGISVLDSTFNIVAITDTCIKYGGYQKLSDRFNFQRVNPDHMKAMRNNPSITTLPESKDIMLIKDVFPHRTFAKNIFKGGSFIYRISVSECVRDFRESDKQLINILSFYIEKYAYSALDPLSPENPTLTRILLEAMKLDVLNKYALDSEITNNNWSPSDTYQIIYLKTFSHEEFINLKGSVNYYCREIMREFPFTYAFADGDNIFALVNTVSPKYNFNTFKQAFISFLKENNFKAGFSNYFSEIYKIRKSYRQAMIALDIGLAEYPNDYSHYFPDLILHYLLREASDEFEKEELISPIYRRLKRYDQNNHSELLLTLEVYLKCRMNATLAAEKLFIHRTTLLYRMNKIYEIGQTDLSGEDELLHLLITYRMMKE